MSGVSPLRRAGAGTAANGALASILARQRLIVCVGSGGVGKTTIAAAIGIAAARRGRRTAVLTIDPARRLQDALGIRTSAGVPHRVTLPPPPAPPGGSLDAMILDTKRTFDGLIRRYAPSPEAAERVLQNRIYQSLSSALAGSQEYMAMERMHELVEEGGYDLLVVDTPPTHHALDFFEAPDRLSALLSSRAAAIFQNPALVLTGEGSRLAQTLLAAVLRGLERFTGLTLLRELADLAGGLDEYSEGFRARAAAVAGMLRAPATSYVLVTTPEPARVAETLALRRELVRSGLPVSGLVLNRTLPAEVALPPAPDVVPPLASPPDLALARKLVAVHRRYVHVWEQERAQIAALAEAVAPAPSVELPLEPVEPTTLARLAALAERLLQP